MNTLESQTLSRLLAAQIVNKALIAELMDQLPHAQRDHVLTRLQVEVRNDPGPAVEGLDHQDLIDEIQRWVSWFDHKARRDD